MYVSYSHSCWRRIKVPNKYSKLTKQKYIVVLILTLCGQ